MSTKTKNYEFVKPELTDTADITATNENWDKIDDQLKAVDGASATEKTTLVDADTIQLNDSGESNKLKKITWANIKMILANVFAVKNHGHTKSEITDFPTSMTPTAHSHSFTDIDDTLPISKGGTGSTSATAAITNLGAASKTHKHTATDINSGTLSSDRLPVIPVAKGGTGASDSSQARANLGISQEYWTFTIEKEDGSTETVTKLVCAT